MPATLVNNITLIPDEYGRVMMRWTPSTLQDFVHLLNTNRMVNHEGYRMVFQIVQYAPGDASLEVSLYSEEKVDEPKAME